MTWDEGYIHPPTYSPPSPLTHSPPSLTHTHLCCSVNGRGRKSTVNLDIQTRKPLTKKLHLQLQTSNTSIIVSFPGLCHLQYPITSSVQIWRKKAWETSPHVVMWGNDRRYKCTVHMGLDHHEGGRTQSHDSYSSNWMALWTKLQWHTKFVVGWNGLAWLT